MRREGSRVGKNIIGGQGRCKKGRVKFIMAQESGGAKGKQRGGKGQGCMMGGSRGRGAGESWDSPCLWEAQGTSVMYRALQRGSKREVITP